MARAAVLAVICVLVAACTATSAPSPRTSPAPSSAPLGTAAPPALPSPPLGTAAPFWQLSDIGHVFVIMLENEGEQSAFGEPAVDPYLATTLRSQGALLPNYYGIGHYSADNYIAFISGQPPNVETQGDCGTFANFTTTSVLPGGIQAGDGCVYPASIASLPTQLSAAGFTWKAYEQAMGNIASREAASCGHPAIGQQDHTQRAVPGDGYAARHDPFVYFHAIIDQAEYCDQHVVALGSPSGAMPPSALKGETGLAADLRSEATTPNFSFITPNLCDDGHDFPCANQTSGPTVWADVDGFLSTWVPKIEASPAFHHGGLLMITFDEASGGSGESASCCNERPAPGASTAAGINGPGGGRVGALLISPYIRPGTVDPHEYNHYSALATFEAIFGLKRLADAAGVPLMDGSVLFNRT